MITVKKWDKTKEPYNREKLVRTIRRYGLNQREAVEVAMKIEDKLFDGVSTKEIQKLMMDEITASRFIIRKRDLRAALGQMKSKPDFEVYVQELLRGLGYKVASNKVIQGFCVTHEIDGVAEKDGKQYYIETKHHSKYHIRTPFIAALAAKAKLDDIRHGYAEGKNMYDFERVILICNTRMTTHALRYSKCVGIEHIGWNSPKNHGLEKIITQTRLYPFTVLPSITANERKILSSMGATTILDIINLKTNQIPANRLIILKKEAKAIR
ncbi:MAG: ATP cone domain-containing protein [Candidatus Bathyarchaeota archaeon]|nr:ATP cone domain-containing protein [Candidatus Bathyarchaeota archaeon]